MANKPNTPDPYAPIEKRSLVTHDGMRSNGYTVRLADEAAPTGWREVGVVSQDYLLVPNADVRDLAFEICDRSGIVFEEEKVFFDGKRYALALAAKEDHASNPLVETRPGDYVGLGMLFENSYDGSRRLSASLFAYRLACSNGMLVRDLFKRVAFRHTRSSRGWEGEVERALAMLAGAPRGLERFAEGARNLTSMRTSASRLREIREAVLPKLPVTLWGKTMDRFLLAEQLDGFGLLNAATNVLWHEERPTASMFGWNEYAASGLVSYALGAERTN